MRNNRYLYGWGVAFFLMTVALALFSWIGSIYGIAEVQSLLSAEGVRWILSRAVTNYVQVPALGIVFVLMMGLGVVSRSGLFDTLRRAIRKDKKLSRKRTESLGLVLRYRNFVCACGTCCHAFALEFIVECYR